MSTILLVACGGALVGGGVIGLLLADRRARPQLEQQRVALARAERQSAELDTQIAEVRHASDQLGGELAAARAHGGDLERDLARAQQELAESARRSSDWQAQLEDLRRKELAGERALAEARAGLRRVLEQDKLKSDQLAALRDELRAAQQAAEGLGEQAAAVAALGAERDRLTERQQATADTLASREVEMSRLRAETEDLRQQLEQATQGRTASTGPAKAQPQEPTHSNPVRVSDVLDTDPDLHAGAREAIRMLYERFTKNKAARPR